MRSIHSIHVRSAAGVIDRPEQVGSVRIAPKPDDDALADDSFSQLSECGDGGTAGLWTASQSRPGVDVITSGGPDSRIIPRTRSCTTPVWNVEAWLNAQTMPA